MYTAAELALLRLADEGGVIPGIDTQEGDIPPPSSQSSIASISTSHAAPFYYVAASNQIDVTQAGAVLNGYNFGSATVQIEANNVTIENSTFSGTTGYFSLKQNTGYSGAVVEDDSFNGAGSNAGLVASADKITLTNNYFTNASGDAVDLGAGTVSNNYFSGGGYSAATHSDAIWVTNTTGPVTISNNFVDWTANGAASAMENDAVRITTELGSVSNVNVTGNVLMGGTHTIDAGNVGTDGTFSNVNINGNYIGFSEFGSFSPGPGTGVTTSNNTTFDFSNPTYSSQAWTAYQASGIETTHLVEAAAANGATSGLSSGSTTLYGGGMPGKMQGSANETVFVGGAGGQNMYGGSGANVFTYLAISDSTPQSSDYVGFFDPTKDVIDLSAIDANPVATGAQNFTFIGTAAFSGSGAQVRDTYNATTNETLVEADLAGDNTNILPDLEIRVAGNVTLSAANFALTAAQSSADLAAGAALSVTKTTSQGASALAYTGVQGKTYSSFTEVMSSTGTTNAVSFDNSRASGTMAVYGGGLTVTEGSNSQSISEGGPNFTVNAHATETISTTGADDSFIFQSGFGADTLSGFTTSGAGADSLGFSASTFSYLNSGMSQSQDLAAVLSNATSSASGLTIADTQGDHLTLLGATSTALTADAANIKFS